VLYLLDTNTCSDIMDEHAVTLARAAAIPGADPVVTCVIVHGEILFGIVRMPAGKKRERLSRKADEVLADMRIEPVPASAADLYARVKATRESRGLRMDENDLWIAATALSLNAILVTRDFNGIDGLQVQDWSKSP
jgi:tRNA(fMet)-specific endonuclease VapC